MKADKITTPLEFDLENDYIYPIVETYLNSVNLFKKFFEIEGFNITPQQWHAINRLYQENGISQVELAKRTFKDYTYTTRLLDSLEKRGFIIRIQDKKDRRSNKIFLTKKGIKFRSTIIPKFLDITKQTRIGLSDKDIEDIRKICRRIVSNYKKIDKIINSRN